MNNPGLKEEIWNALRQKWAALVAEGHTLKVEFNILNDPANTSRAFAIDVAQNIDGEWVVQTVQRQMQEAYTILEIDGKGLDQLVNIAAYVVSSATELITKQEADVAEIHIFMKRISPKTSEIYGHVTSKTGEKNRNSDKLSVLLCHKRNFRTDIKDHERRIRRNSIASRQGRSGQNTFSFHSS